MTEHIKAEWRNNERNLPDGSYIDNDDDICHIKNGEKHREDGPAIECADGDKLWYRSGERHRDDGPAIEYADGNKSWYKNGKRHREDGPAMEWAGKKEWYINGERCGTEVAYEEKLKIWKMNEAMK